MAAPYAQAIRSVPWRGRDALVVFILPWIVLPIVAYLILQLLAPQVPGVASYLKALDASDPAASFGLVVVDFVGSFLTIGYFLRKYKAHWSTLGLRRFNLLKVIGYMLLILLSFTLLVAAAYYVIQLVDPHFNADQAQTNEFTGQFSPLNLLALVILPPLVEEATFRGFIFPAFAKRYGVAIGAVISSVLFGFAHLQANVSVYTFILGLLLCWLYSRTGSIIPGMAVHMINNYLAYMAQGTK